MRRTLWFAWVLATPCLGVTPAWATAYTLFTLDDPGAFGTSLTGVNNEGVIVGNGYPESGLGGGFSYAGSVFTPVTLPYYSGAVDATGINDFGTIVGNYFPSSSLFGTSVGFTLSGADLTSLDLGSGFFPTDATGINNNGDVTSSVFYTPSSASGYLTFADGTTVGIPLPPGIPDSEYAFALPNGLNDADVVVGSETAFGAQTLVYQSGVSSYFSPPAAYQSTGYDINNVGQIVGSYEDYYGKSYGYIDTDGSFQTIVFPGATGTSVTGINDTGEIIGDYSDTSGVEHGFYGLPVATAVPEPPSLLIMAGAAAGFVLLRRSRASLLKPPAERDHSGSSLDS